MAQEYSATDPRTGLQITIRGDFPADPEERVRIARTANLFTKLLSTILSTENTTERRERFRAIETQLEIADALIRGDGAEVQRLLRDTLSQMGVTEEQMQQVESELRRQNRGHGRRASPRAARPLWTRRRRTPTPRRGHPPRRPLSRPPAPATDPIRVLFPPSRSCSPLRRPARGDTMIERLFDMLCGSTPPAPLPRNFQR